MAVLSGVLKTDASQPERVSRFRWLVGVTVIGLMVNACAGGVATPAVSSSGPDDSAGSSRTDTTTTQTSQPTTTTSPALVNSLPPAADVLITPSGVAVVVLEHTGLSFLVQTPCGNEATVRSGTPQGSVQVVLDPGHGGESDPGAVGPNGLSEASVNLRVAIATRDLLESRGVSTILTRSGDHGSTLTVRADLADTLTPEVMVSIHHNAPTPNASSVPGTEVFVQNDTPDSRRLGQLLYASIFDELATLEDVSWAAAPDAGVLEVLLSSGADAYGMLRNPETVTALAELGYISNGSEARLMTTGEYPEIAARAITGAIVAYLDTDDQGRGYVDEPRVFRPNRGISSSACQDPALD